MKILLLSGEAYPFFIETANALHKKGYDLHVLCFRDLTQANSIENLNRDILFYKNIVAKSNIDRNKLFWLNIPLLVYRIRKIIREIEPDILHAFNLKWGGWLAALSGFKPFILTGLGSDILIEQGATKNIILKYLRKYTIKRADFITVVSEQMKRQVNEIDNEKETIFFAPGADPNKYQPGNPSKEFVNKFKKQNQKVIFSPRALKPLYQIKEIVLAFEKLYKKNSDLLLIIGGNTNNEYAEQVKKMIKEKNLSGNVFFTGRVPQEKWCDYFRISDIVVSYPYNDGMPATIFESMAMKKALILSDVPSIKQIVTDKKVSLLSDKNSYHDLAKKIEYLIKNDKEREKLSQNAFRIFKKYGNSKKQLENLEKIYSKILYTIL